MHLETSLPQIAIAEIELQNENDHFIDFIRALPSSDLDTTVHSLNETIAPLIDCTACGNCCNSLMINVTEAECASVSEHLNLSVAAFKETYIETSMQGALIMNTIPCAFLEEKKCTVYTKRFTECREFPHLHKANFKERIFGTIMHYGRCPIIYNVIEQLKISLQFKDNSI